MVISNGRRNRGRSGLIQPQGRTLRATARSRRRRHAARSWSWPSRSTVGSASQEGDPIRFYVELLSDDASLDRAPREGIFELTVPTPDFERIMWQV